MGDTYAVWLTRDGDSPVMMTAKHGRGMRLVEAREMARGVRRLSPRTNAEVIPYAEAKRRLEAYMLAQAGREGSP